jgi:hypothetical protein
MLVGRPLVAGDARYRPRRARDPIGFGERRMMTGDQPDLGICTGKQQPAVETVSRCKFEEPVGGALAIGACPGNAPFDITGIFRDRMVVGGEPDRNAVPAETAGNREAAMGAAENDRAGAMARPRDAVGFSRYVFLPRHDDAPDDLIRLPALIEWIVAISGSRAN